MVLRNYDLPVECSGHPSPSRRGAEDVNLSDCRSTVFAFGASDLVVD